MAQLATAAVGDQLGHNSHVVAPYVYDIEHRGGLAMPTIAVDDVEDIALTKMRVGSGALICPVRTGAAVQSAAGGTITGLDMYGQPISETVAAAGVSNRAFATVNTGPGDVRFANKFGLPYRYDAAAANPTAGITIQAPAAGDARGTFTVDAGVTGPAEYEVRYMADRANLYGTAEVDHADAGDVGGTVVAVTATVDATGLVTVTLPAAGDGPDGVTITFPDGTTVRANRGDAPVTHTLKPEWMSRYADVYDDAALDRAIAVAFDNTDVRSVYASVTGALV